MSFEKHTHYFPSVLTLLSRIAGLLAITASYVHNVHDVHRRRFDLRPLLIMSTGFRSSEA